MMMTAKRKQVIVISRILCTIICFAFVSSKSKIPEASSTLLKIAYQYNEKPHDRTLYDLLKVQPNATHVQLQKSFRRICRDLHPDKRRRRRKKSENPNEQINSGSTRANVSSNKDDDDDDEKLEQVREAYEVLKSDETRLPYHKYGLMDTSLAAALLTGGEIGNIAVLTKDQRKLLCLMGFGPEFSGSSYKARHRQRVHFIAANLVERIRPLVENTLSEEALANSIAKECDKLKLLPLGAQILRCIGRAYKHVGSKVLRRYRLLYGRNQFNLFQPVHSKGIEISDSIRDSLRNTKHLLEAAMISGKLVVTEHVSKQRNEKNDKSQNGSPSISYHNEEVFIDGLIGEEDIDNLSDHLQSNEEIRDSEQEKAQKALLESLQVDALWKISKIDLDRTIQEACNLILHGECFFFPSHSSSRQSDWRISGDGWVSQAGEMIDVRLGVLRAARALVLVGDVMVKCSKEGTAWKN